MSIAIKKTPEANLKYLIAYDANEIDHPVAEWAHDPNIDAVEETPIDYWKWDETSSTVLPMTGAEQTLVDEYTTKDQVMTDVGLVNVNITDSFEKSTIDGKKLSVHASTKPELGDGSTTYVVWTGAGDDMSDPVNGLGNGALMQLHTEVDVVEQSVDIHFNPVYGRVWVHEAYMKFKDGKKGDTMSCYIMASGVPLQQAAYLDLVLDGDIIKFSAGGPGTGTHGFADPTKITLIDRRFQKDGFWNFSAEGGLTPNFGGTGEYNISRVDQIVNRFINRIACAGQCDTYFMMSSDETTEILPNYYIRVVSHNESNQIWFLSCMMEIYRQVTYN